MAKRFVTSAPGQERAEEEKKPLLKFATNVIVCFPHSFRVVRMRLSLYVCLRAPDIRKI